MTTPDPYWRDRARCLGVDTEVFFTPGKDGKYEDARPFCEGCPVAAECLEATMRQERGAYPHGFSGNTTPDERRALQKLAGTGPTSQWDAYEPTEAQDAQWRRLWQDGMGDDAIASRSGVKRNQVRRWRKRNGLGVASWNTRKAVS